MKRDILYVDDELDNLIVFEATFESHFNIWTANSGQEALSLLGKQAFPVVIADQRMPGMTGTELFEVMQSKFPRAKRVMLTGYADSKAMLDAINQGQVYHFIKKPWERDAVLSVLMRAIEAHDLAMANMALTERLITSDRCASLGQSAARIAHEMGNQLCMLPLLELIEDEYRDHPELTKAAAFARRTHDRLVQLVEDVKSFVRFEHETVNMQPTRLSGMIDELLEFLRFDQSLPLAQLSVDIQADPYAQASKSRLQQVLLNLLKNAAHAIEGRPNGQVTIKLEQTESEAVLSVKDNGHGMSPEVIDRIWEPFFTTKGKAGTGLGLDVTKAILEAHGGKIECASQPGEGAKFTIKLPLAQPTVVPPIVTVPSLHALAPV